MKALIVPAVIALSLSSVHSAQAFHKYGQTGFAFSTYRMPAQSFAAPGFSYGYAALPAQGFAAPGFGCGSGAFPVQGYAGGMSFYTPSAGYFPAAMAVAPASFLALQPVSFNLPSAGFLQPGGGFQAGTLLDVLDLIDRITAWTNKNRPDPGTSSKDIEALRSDVKEVKDKLSKIKDLPGLEDTLKEIRNELQKNTEQIEKMKADIKKLKG